MGFLRTLPAIGRGGQKKSGVLQQATPLRSQARVRENIENERFISPCEAVRSVQSGAARSLVKSYAEMQPSARYGLAQSLPTSLPMEPVAAPRSHRERNPDWHAPLTPGGQKYLVGRNSGHRTVYRFARQDRKCAYYRGGYLSALLPEQ